MKFEGILENQPSAPVWVPSVPSVSCVVWCVVKRKGVYAHTYDCQTTVDNVKNFLHNHGKEVIYMYVRIDKKEYEYIYGGGWGRVK